MKKREAEFCVQFFSRDLFTKDPHRRVLLLLLSDEKEQVKKLYVFENGEFQKSVDLFITKAELKVLRQDFPKQQNTHTISM